MVKECIITTIYDCYGNHHGKANTEKTEMVMMFDNYDRSIFIVGSGMPVEPVRDCAQDSRPFSDVYITKELNHQVKRKMLSMELQSSSTAMILVQEQSSTLARDSQERTVSLYLSSKYLSTNLYIINHRTIREGRCNPWN